MSSLMHLVQLSLPGKGGKFINPVTDSEEENNITITRERNTLAHWHYCRPLTTHVCSQLLCLTHVPPQHVY